MNLVSPMKALSILFKDIEPYNKYRHIAIVQKNYCSYIYINGLKRCKTSLSMHQILRFLRLGKTKYCALNYETFYCYIDDDMNIYKSLGMKEALTDEKIKELVKLNKDEKVD